MKKFLSGLTRGLDTIYHLNRAGACRLILVHRRRSFLAHREGGSSEECRPGTPLIFYIYQMNKSLVIAALMAAVALAACGKKEEAPAPAPAPAVEQPAPAPAPAAEEVKEESTEAAPAEAAPAEGQAQEEQKTEEETQ